jgi:hypothetical protein
MSTANDLSKYYKALLQSWHGQAQLKEGPFDKLISWLFAPLQIMQRLHSAKRVTRLGGPEASYLPRLAILASILG